MKNYDYLQSIPVKNYSWDYGVFNEILIYEQDEEDENTYNCISHIVEQLLEENKNFVFNLKKNKMTKQEFIKTRKYVKMDSVGYSYLKENAPHILDEYDYADKEWREDVLGVYLYDEVYYIFHHKGNVFSTIVGRENFIEEDISLVENPIWEYAEFEYNAVNNINQVG